MNINYQYMLDETLKQLALNATKPKLLLHCCCAPCSSYVLKYLLPYFDITALFYNPNIFPKAEHERRLDEFHRFCQENDFGGTLTHYELPYTPDDFYATVKGLEDLPEGGARCEKCFELRLKKSAQIAKAIDAHYFTTTLSISPHKNAALLNTLGQRLGEAHGVPYLCSDFKKKEGYKQSLQLSAQYGLYRQDYCGCVFSQQEAAVRRLK